VRDRKVALPAGVARVGFGQMLGNRERGLVAGQRRRQIVLRLLHVADLVVRDRQVALPAGVARVGFGQTLGNREQGPARDMRRWSGAAIGRFGTTKCGGSEDLGNYSERVVGVLVVTPVLPLRQLDFLSRQLLVRDLTQNVRESVEPRPPFVVGVNDVPRRP
jgi:hypothetical protein